ncbi:GNAT family N-acetyltransferase [Cognatiyoonia sp. IB215182]|uniref:GNAT family N-acetyltransferase n=1 Tax=Cognatiyoonia sp. IB215182 TaxID=3097353 RepID=UPI002A15388D|nr:GNAT family N-acetyltransferase [Cognatiyoonia sp. IB215182]MDX8353421.1 GNAT family N-acetyltransferase [Cognatiyoonia sp. IB215182]
MSTLSTGLHDVANDHLATVVTYLEMTEPQAQTPHPFPTDAAVDHQKLSVAAYLDIFRAVGAPWLWTSRLTLPETELASILNHPDVETWIIQNDGGTIGLLELDFREPDACELAFFGLTQAATGKGLGKPMMSLAQSRAFSRPISRFHVHTCTLDSLQALTFYRRSGFTPYKRAVEIFADPRASGVHSKEAGAHIPFLS